MSNKIVITRADLAKVFPDHHLVVLFEQLLSQVSNLLPADVETLTIAVNTAQATADSAHAELDALGTMSAQNSYNVSITNGTITANLTNNQPTLLTTSVTLSNNSGTSNANINNSPVAGAPSKWIAINDNGTLRRIPTW